MVTRGGGNFSVMAASPRAFRRDRRNQRKPAVPVAPRSGREPPKSTARDLTRVRFQSCRVCGASYFAILAIPGRPLTRWRPKGQLNPAGFSFAFAGCGKLLTLLFPMLLERARKSGGPPLLAPSFKGQRDVHIQRSGVAVAPGPGGLNPPGPLTAPPKTTPSSLPTVHVR